MGWIKESISWANFVTVLRETIDELRKSLGQHSTELQDLRQQNQLLLQQLVQQANDMQRLERKLEGIELHLRAPIIQSHPVEAVVRQPMLSQIEGKRDSP